MWHPSPCPRWKCLNGHIYLKRNLYRFSDQAFLGTMLSELEAPVFYNIIKDISNTADSKAYIIDADSNIIVGSDVSMTGQKIDEELYEQTEQLKSGFYQIRLDQKNCNVYVGNAISNGWQLVLTLPENYYMKAIRTLQYFTFALMGIIGVISIGFIVVVGRSLTRPLKNLTTAMEDVGRGKFDVSIPIEREDEIGMLSRTFNQMVLDMRGNILKNAIICSLRYLPYSILMACILVIPILLTGFVESIFPLMIVLWIFGGSSLIAFAQFLY